MQRQQTDGGSRYESGGDVQKRNVEQLIVLFRQQKIKGSASGKGDEPDRKKNITEKRGTERNVVQPAVDNGEPEISGKKTA